MTCRFDENAFEYIHGPRHKIHTDVINNSNNEDTLSLCAALIFAPAFVRLLLSLPPNQVGSRHNEAARSALSHSECFET